MAPKAPSIALKAPLDAAKKLLKLTGIFGFGMWVKSLRT